MALIINPEKYLNGLRKKRKIRLIDGKISLNLMTFIKKYFDIDEQKAFYRVIKDYKRRIEEARSASGDNFIIKDVVNDYKQAENLLDDMLLYNYMKKIKKEYKDKYFIWLPSTAKQPRHSHMPFYGQKFSMTKGADGKGLIPGMAFGCKCGMKIL
jgi:hypothetical protein